MKRQGGFAVISVIVIVVILAVLAGGLLALSTTQSSVLSQDIQSARADQTARAGVQWGLRQAFLNANVWGAAGNASCNNAPFAAPVAATIPMAAVNGFQVTVSCGSALYNEGETGNPAPNNNRQVRVYQIMAIACPFAPAPAACPRADAAATYVERRREAVGI